MAADTAALRRAEKQIERAVKDFGSHCHRAAKTHHDFALQDGQLNHALTVHTGAEYKS